MGLFFVYILKSSVCLAAFYLFYRLLLSRETFHRFNRFALLGILLLSCLLPLIEVSVQQETGVHQTMISLEQWLLLAEAMNSAEIQTQEATVTWIQVAVLLYLAGILFFAFRNIYSLLRLLVLLKSGRRENLSNYVSDKKGVSLIVHNKEIAPFSWIRYIVISQKDLDENGREILIHELAHIHNRHSLDLLVADICIFFQWFNPASWLLKQELQNIHEYEADETVIKEGVDAKQYQLLLIKKAVGTRLYSMANSFNHSKLKKRITMMLKEKSSPWARMKYLYVLPLAAIAVTAFARPEVSNTAQEISAVKVNDLAAIVETKMAESMGNVLEAPAVKALPEDTTKTGKVSSTVVQVSSSRHEEPLYIINGKETDAEIMRALNPESIESIDVLKDESAVSRFGEKGKNGVILITLKEGKSSTITVTGVKAIKKTTDIPGVSGVHVSNRKVDVKDLNLYVDGELVNMEGKQVEDIVPADQIESISVNKTTDGKGEMYIVTKKNAKGQEKTVSQGNMKVEGSVKDEQGEPLINASVLIEGTTTGTLSDSNGNFVLSVPNKDVVLLVSYINMKPARVKVSSQMTVVLKEE
ncbi:carboxypeptidase-like regulatory domain-containing protein [Bacteroides sp.]|uniref:M56 family metallopeptidase n=1 Tax=Bacteroides sp. TaxID=29523 RepID=UPI002601B5D1|nr:M56 family metallopeptidase [Bacteroides sp.]